MSPYPIFSGQSLDERRRNLRMTVPQLARRSGVSTATVARVLRGEPTVAVGHACAIADALGMEIALRSRVSVDTIIREAARERARRATAIVQATSSLEGQGLTKHDLQSMEDRTCRELQVVGGKILWDD